MFLVLKVFFVSFGIFSCDISRLSYGRFFPATTFFCYRVCFLGFWIYACEYWKFTYLHGLPNIYWLFNGVKQSNPQVILTVCSWPNVDSKPQAPEDTWTSNTHTHRSKNTRGSKKMLWLGKTCHMLSLDQLTIGAHWSPLELENMNIGMAKLIHMVITIGARWSPLELQI